MSHLLWFLSIYFVLQEDAIVAYAIDNNLSKEQLYCKGSWIGNWELLKKA